MNQISNVFDVYRGGWQNVDDFCPSSGDIIDFNRTTYTHHGIYVGNGNVVHKVAKYESPTIATILLQSLRSRCTMHSQAMMTSPNRNISVLLALCAGNSPVTGEFPAQRPVTRSFDVFFDLRLNRQLSKQSWGWWFGTPSRSLWLHCNGQGCLAPIMASCRWDAY